MAPLADQLGAVDPQGIVTGLIADEAPELAQSDTIDPQGVLNHLIRKGLDQRQQRKLERMQDAEKNAPPDLTEFGQTPEQADAQPKTDFTQFGEQEPEEAKPKKPEQEWGGYAPVIGKSAAQGLTDLAGAAAQGAGVIGTSGRVAGSKQQLDMMNRVDQGERFHPFDDPVGYQDMTPDQRKEHRAKMEPAYQEIMKEKPEDTAAYRTGKEIKQWGEKTFPLTDTEKTSITSRVTKGLTSVAPLVGLGIVAPELAIPAGAAIFGASSAGDTYQDARTKGADVDTAMKAANMSGAVNAALGVIPIGAVLTPLGKVVPQALAPAFEYTAMKILAGAAKDGIVFATVGEAQEYIGQQIAKSYNPAYVKKLEGEKAELQGRIDQVQADPKLAAVNGAWLKNAQDGLKAYDHQIEEASGYKLDAERVIASFLTGAIVGGAGEGARALAGRRSAAAPAEAPAGSAEPAEATGPVAGSLPPPGEPGAASASAHGPEPGPKPSSGGGATEPPAAEAKPGETAEKPEPFETKLRPKLRDTLESKAAYYKEYDADTIKSWSDDKLKEYVNGKFGFGSRADEGEVLRRAGYSDDDIKGMSPEQKKSAVDDALRNGVHAGAEAPAEGTREAPIDLQTGEDVTRAADVASKEHSHAQGEANNVQRGHVVWNGGDGENLYGTIEVGAGGTRRGLNPATGEPWETAHTVPYGYIKGTEGADGMHVDAYWGKEPTGDHPVYVLDERDHETGEFRQHKAFIGFASPKEAIKAYLGTSTKLPQHIGGLRALTVDEFKNWVKRGDTKAPLSEAMGRPVDSKAGETDNSVRNGRGTEDNSILPDEQGEAEHEAGPEHHAAVEEALRAAGENPEDVRPADIARAAQIHATEGAPPDQAFTVAVVRNLVDEGHVTRDDIVKAVGDEATKDIMEPGHGSEREPRAEAPGAATGGTASEKPGPVDQGGRQPGEEIHPSGKAAVAEGAGAAREAGATSDTAERRRAADNAAGRKRDAEAPAEQRTGVEGERGRNAAQHENAENALIGARTSLPEHKVSAADGTSIRVAPIVVEAKDLIVSSDKGYDASLQPRERNRAASKAQVREIATRLDPERLGYSSEADRGAPIVGPDRMVESGNGRIMALRAVYRMGSPNAKRYRDWLSRQGVDVSKFKEPVLVRQRLTPLEPEARQAFTVSANQASTLAMSAPERAAADAQHLTPEMLGHIVNGGNLAAIENRPFIRAFIAAIPASERGALANAEGGLSAEGLTRARNAILARAYGDTDVIARITESTDDAIKSISNALTAAAPAWAKFVADIEAGHVRRDLNLTAELMEAVKRTADLRNRGQKLDQALAQIDALDQLKGPVEGFMRIFYDAHGRRAAGASHIAEGLRYYATEAGKATTDPRLGLDIPEVSANDIQRRTLEKAHGIQPGGGAGVRESGAEARPEEPGHRTGEGGEEAGPGDEFEPRRGFAEDKNPFTSEPGVEGKEQLVIPGAERVSSADLAKRRAQEPLTAKVAQKPAEHGLFAPRETQADLVAEVLKSPAAASHIEGKETAHGHGSEGSGVRTAAPEVPRGQPARSARRTARRKRPQQLSLFGGGERGAEVRNAARADEQLSRSAEPAVPSEGERVTKPPAVSRGNRARRDRVSAEGGLETAREKIAERSRLNYRITDEDKLGEGGPKVKVGANLDAIRTLKAIEEEGRLATPEEKAILVKYTGWGAVAQQVFDTNRHSPHAQTWKTEREALRALLTDEEIEAARASTLNAHYTSPDVIAGMWDALDHLGFKGGLAIEPSAGIGHFIGLTPDKVAPKTAWTAVELDPVTGRIAKALYGGAEVNVQGYQDLKRPANYYDLAISNVPFGDYNITEKPHGTFSIHDFFFVKAIDQVRPGGVVAFITSRYTMDKVDNGMRRLLANKADLVGAIRLPGGRKGAFSANAGTEVTTDIVFLRKKIPGEKPFAGTGWMDLAEIQTKDGPVKINEYFADHPEMMLGEMRLQGTQYKKDEPVLIGDPEGIRDKIAAAARGMPPDAMLARGRRAEPETVHANDIEGPVKDGAFFVKGDKVFQRRNGAGHEQGFGPEDRDRVRRLVGMRDTVNDLLAAQLASNTARSADIRGELNRAYKAFVTKHGPINKEITTVTSRTGRTGEPIVITKLPNLSKFKSDPDAWKVAAIEVYDAESGTAKPADIQTKDVIAPPTERTINGPGDALAASLDQTGEIDLDHIAESLGMDTHEAVVAALGDLVFLNPDGRKYQTAERYLSGDVVKKLEEAKAIAAQDATYQGNVAALQKVQPEPLTRSDISAQFGAPWIPAEVYEAFLKESLGASANSKVRRVPVSGEFRAAVGTVSREAQAKYATDRVPIDKIINAALNNQQVTVYDDIGDGKKAVNHEATQLARLKTDALKETFTGVSDGDGWAWADDARAKQLEAIYNRTYNNLVPLKVDGSHLTLPGLNPLFSDRAHRKSAVWRMIQYGNTLLDHFVGSGKTVTMIAGGMEMKRLGLINKPAYVVPNHMLEQFSREFIQAYPNAKILVAQKDEMTRDNRKEFLAKAAANDWDGIIITHDAFGRINMAHEFRLRFVRDQLSELERVIRAEAETEGKSSPTVKGLEKAKQRLLNQLEKLLAEERKDTGVSFEESGIDHLFVDEAHKYKNLSFITRMQRVKGLAQGNSQRAEDLFLKIRYLEQKRPGRSAVFATGTPVSNTMAELWTMQRYLQLDKLRERDLDTFDAWANTFGRVVNNMELSADGRTVQEVSSFSKFVNVPELIALYAEVADTVTADQLNLPRPRVVRPDGTEGIEIVEALPSPHEEGYINELVKLAESLKGRRPQPGEPNMLSVVTRGRKVATDGRLVGLPENPHGKIALAAKNIHDIWRDGKAPGLVQMVFLDMGVPQSRSAKKVEVNADSDADPAQIETARINLYGDLKSRLAAMGVPENQIAFIHDAADDAKKAKLFQKVRRGEVRVLVGSTEKMGVGTNVQDLLTAMHHLDAPWKPAEVTQRDGRIVRQGNKNKEVRILRYVTKRSFDAFMWQKLDTKSKFIGQVLSGAKGSRHAEDIDNPLPEAAEMKAAASGDPRILEHAELDRQVRSFEAQKRAFEAAKSRATWEAGQARSNIDRYEAALPGAKVDAAKVADLSGDNFKATLDGQEFTDRAKAGDKVKAKILSLDHQTFYSPKVVHVGIMSGFDMNVRLQTQWSDNGGYLAGELSLKGERGYGAAGGGVVFNPQTDGAGIMRRFGNILLGIAQDAGRIERNVATEREGLARIQKMLGETWPKEKEYRAALSKFDELTKALTAKPEKTQPGPSSSEAGMPSRSASAGDTGVQAPGMNSSGEAPPSTQPTPGFQDSTRPEPSASESTRATPPSIFEGPTETFEPSGFEEPAGFEGAGPPAAFSDFRLGDIEPTSKKHIVQGSNDINALHAAAEKNKSRFVSRLRELADSVPGTEFYSARVKDLAGVTAKAIAKGRPASTISDFLGGRIIVDTPQAMHALIDKLDSIGAVIDRDNFITAGNNGGYRAYHVQVGLGDGTSAELQLVPRAIAEMMSLSHAIRQPVKHFDLRDPEQHARYEAIIKSSREVMDNAWARASEDWKNYDGTDPLNRGLAEGPAYRTPNPHTDLGPFKFMPGEPIGQQAQNYVTRRGKGNGIEFLLAIDANGNAIAHGYGSHNKTGMPSHLDAAMRDPTQSIVIHHNHPNNSSLSIPDLAQLGQPGVAAIWAHGHDGQVTRGALTPRARQVLQEYGGDYSVRKIYDAGQKINRSFYAALQAAINRHAITVEEARDINSALAPQIFARAGVIDFEATHDYAHYVERLNLEPLIEDGVRYIAGDFFHDPGAIAGTDRRAEPVRSPGDMGASFGRSDEASRPNASEGRNDRQRGRLDRAQETGQLALPGFSAGGDEAFRHWFGDSLIKDDSGEPLVVYRGEHGEAEGTFHTRSGSLSFGSQDAANTYAMSPNDRRDTPHSPRVAAAYLKVERPWLNDKNDPFVDFSKIEAAVGRDAAVEIARKYANYFEHTNNWEENFSQDYSSVGDLIDRDPQKLDQLYAEAHPLLDDHEFIKALQAKGYDGAIYGGSGETALEAEYRVFSPDQARPAIGGMRGFGEGEGLAEGPNPFAPGAAPGPGGPRTATGSGGAGMPPGTTPPTATASPPPPGRPRKALPAVWTENKTIKAFKHFWQSTFQPELVSDRAMEADPLFARYKAAQAQEKDAVIKASESEWGYWNKRSDAERIRFLDDMETRQFGATPADPQQAAMARRYRVMLDNNWALEKAFGSQAAFVEDYLPHIWEKPEEWRAFSETRSAQVGPTWFQKKRSIDYITDGLAAGLKLQFTNPVDIVVHRLLSGVDMRQRMQLLFDLKSMGLAWEGVQGGEQLVRRGWRAINAPDRKQWVIAPEAQILWKNAVDAKGLWQAEHLGGSMFRGWMVLKNVWVPIKLALSAFHPLHVLHINYSDGMARAFDDVVKGRDPVAALRSLGQGFGGPMQAAPGATTGAAIGATVGAFTPVGPYWGGIAGAAAGAGVAGALKRAGVPTLPHTGKTARKAWATRPTQQTPEQKAMVTLMTEGGFVPQLSEEMKIKSKRQLAVAWQKAIRREAGVSEWRRLISGAMRRPIEVLQHQIFEEWIPNLKAAAYLNEAAALLRRNPDLLSNDKDRRIALRAIGQQIDSRFGEKFYGSMFWNRYVKDAAIGSFLSLGWNYGFVHQFGGAAMEAISRPAGLVPQFRPGEPRKVVRRTTNKIAFALAYLGSAALINGLMTLAYTGDMPEGLDYIFARIGGLNPDGTQRRVTNMFYLREAVMLTKHVQERGGNWLTGSYEMLTNKLMFEPFKELLNNRTYYGYNIWDEEAPIYQQIWQGLKHVFSDQTDPMSISGARHAGELSGVQFPTWGETFKDPGAAADKFVKAMGAKGVGESVAGFGPAPAYAEKTAVQNRIAYLYGEHVSPASRPEAEGEISKEKMSVRTAIMVARQNKDMDALQAAYARGKSIGLKPDYMNKIGREAGDLYMFGRLPNADQKSLLEHASPQERQRYWPRAHQAVKTELNRKLNLPALPANAPAAAGQ